MPPDAASLHISAGQRISDRETGVQIGGARSEWFWKSMNSARAVGRPGASSTAFSWPVLNAK